MRFRDTQSHHLSQTLARIRPLIADYFAAMKHWIGGKMQDFVGLAPVKSAIGAAQSDLLDSDTEGSTKLFAGATFTGNISLTRAAWPVTSMSARVSCPAALTKSPATWSSWRASSYSDRAAKSAQPC
jgi:hypothetical protein